MRVPATETVVRGIVGGVIGTAVLTAFEPIEHALLAHVPPYALSPMAERARSHRALRNRDTQTAARIARWTYGPAWGVAFAWAGARSRGATSRSVAQIAGEGAALAAAIWIFEIVALPALGVVPPLGAWRRRDLFGLAAHTLSFGVATSAAIAVHESFER